MSVPDEYDVAKKALKDQYGTDCPCPENADGVLDGSSDEEAPKGKRSKRTERRHKQKQPLERSESPISVSSTDSLLPDVSSLNANEASKKVIEDSSP